MSTNANYKQMIHIHQHHVGTLMRRMSNDLRSRGNRHDISKFSGIEATIGGMNYEEYSKINVLHPNASDVQEYTEKTKAALIEHYKLNDHHIEHFENGLSDMSLVQLAELICDSVAHLTERGYTPTECVCEIENQFKKYESSDEIVSIVKNTVKYLCGE